MILFIQMADAAALIRISHARSAPEYMRNIQALYAAPLRLIGQRQSRDGLLARIRVLFASAHQGNEWYRPTPELLRYILDGPASVPRSRSRRLSAREALEVFRAAHESTETYSEIGARFGVSPCAVAAVASGRTHGYLFRRQPDTADKGVYWISEAIDGARWFRMRVGKRSPRGHAARQHPPRAAP